MADDEITKQPGSITKTADNSQERISQVSNVNSAISQMQRKVDRQLDEAEATFGDNEGIERVQSSFSKVLNELSNTVSSIGTGFAKIAGDTARVGTNSVKQYGRAISQDISYNKQNIISLALSRTSPLFGYFAGKFMETDVFKSAKEKMKENLSNALGGVTAKLKEGWSKLFKRNKGDQGPPAKNVGKIAEKVPKMAKGGYVEKSGLVSLHAGEVVAPIEKILSRIDESISIAKDLSIITRKAQLNTLAKMSTFVATNEHQAKVGLAKGFMRALGQVNTQYTEPAQQRMLRAVLSIQDSMGATIGTWPQVWQKMLVSHPTFRTIMFSLRGLYTTLSIPSKLVYAVFKSRGGYVGHLSHAKNPMQAAAENLGLIYSEGMWRLDNISKFTKASAEATRDMSSAITGKKYPALEGIPRGVWSIFGITRIATNWLGKYGIKWISRAFYGKEFSDSITEIMSKQRELPLKGLRDFFKGSWKTNLENLYDEQRHAQLGGKKVNITEAAKEAKEASEEQTEKIVTSIHELAEKSVRAADDYGYVMKHVANGTDRLVSISTSAEKTAKTSSKLEKDSSKKIIQFSKKIKEASEENAKVNKESNAREKRRSVFGFLKNIFGIFTGGGIFGLIGAAASFIAPMLSAGILSMVTSPAILGIVSKVLGLAAATGVGWVVGSKVGKKLDDWLGITENIQKTMNEWHAQANRLADKNQEHMMNLSKSARKGGEQGEIDRRKLAAQTHIRTKGGASAEKMKSVGWTGSSDILGVIEGQVKYARENPGEYLLYDQDTIDRVRKEWMDSGKAYPKMPLGNHIKYGEDREKQFLDYLKTKATKTYRFKIAKPIEDQVQAEKTNIMDQAKLKTLELKGMVLDKLNTSEAAKKLQDLQTAGTKALVTSFNNTSSAITNIINNNSSKTINTGPGLGGQQHVGWGRGAYSYTYATIRGDTDED